MNSWLWYLTRSSGIVATVLAVAALSWGFFFSARATGRRLRPAWWLDLHNWLGGAALAFTGVHVVASFLQSNSGIGLKQVFLPQTAAFNATAITLPVIAMYGFIVTVFTSWPRKVLRPRWWRFVHLLSVPATVLAAVHAYQAGSDRSASLFLSMLALLAGVGIYPTALRIFGLVEKRRRPAGSPS